MPRNLIDLHIHVGGAVGPHILWSIAHQQGFKLPFKDYWEFADAVVVKPEKVKNLEDYLGILHEWTEKIQSSPAAIERSVYEIIGKEYRGSHVTADRAALQPDEAQPRRRARPRPHHPRGDARHGPRLPGVRRPRRSHLLSGARVRAAPERDPGREGHQVPRPRRGGHRPRRHREERHRADAHGGRALHQHVPARARGGPGHHRAHRRDARHWRRGRGGGGGEAAARPHRPRHPLGARRARAEAPARARHGARDLPQLESGAPTPSAAGARCGTSCASCSTAR